MNESQRPVALVTGGDRGIGRAIAMRLAADGYDVAITWRTGEAGAEETIAAIEGAGARALAVQCDLADPEQLREAIGTVIATLGPIHTLVNNAGAGVMGPFADITVADVDQLLQVNARAAFLAIQHVAPTMPTGGRIVSIGSCFVERTPQPFASVYTMSKAALMGLTRGLAYELAERHITINLVNPGPTDTEMNPADGPSSDMQRSKMALGEYGSVDDIANAVSFLVGPASSTITGTALNVDNGWAA